MEILDTYSALETLPVWEMVLRIVMAMGFGFVVGIDRERKNKPIDFRAYMIVGVTSCMIAMLGEQMVAATAARDSEVEMDLAKIIAGVLTGIGFLGAGAIIHTDGKRVVGTATGASIWASGGMGLAIGFGFYVMSSIAFAALVFILVGGGLYMQKFHGRDDKENMTDDH